MGAMDVQRPARGSLPEHEATRAVFVARVVFNHHAASQCFFDLLNRDMTEDGLVGGVDGELVFLTLDLSPNLIDHARLGVITILLGKAAPLPVCESSLLLKRTP